MTSVSSAIGRKTRSGPTPQAFIAVISLSWYSRPSASTMPRNKPIGTSTVSCCSVVRPISVATTLPGKSFCAACPSTRANWFDSSTTSSTPVTATKVHVDFAQQVTVQAIEQSSRPSAGMGKLALHTHAASGPSPTTLRMCSLRQFNGRSGRLGTTQSAPRRPDR